MRTGINAREARQIHELLERHMKGDRFAKHEALKVYQAATGNGLSKALAAIDDRLRVRAGINR